MNLSHILSRLLATVGIGHSGFDATASVDTGADLQGRGATPHCGPQRPAMPYHTGPAARLYRETPYGVLGCNHDATIPEGLDAFAAMHKDKPDILRRYLGLVEAARNADSFQELWFILIKELQPNRTARHDPRADAVAMFLIPAYRCRLDGVLLRALGITPLRQPPVPCEQVPGNGAIPFLNEFERSLLKALAEAEAEAEIERKQHQVALRRPQCEEAVEQERDEL
ncbi:e0e185c5-27d9-43f4-8059-f8840bc1bd96 [Thermothielavioides terrestris]|uniref:Uncharacterized protein n=2 Tax=Thermothielavioides terrestris TaxID=2587410 RepID=G2REI5_THETT|nr:uncharacterized protein THITE_2122871 [Thermothielavioides terrestris NRRL 8126]AEO70960.1 hypothetical protein THITE_2122871 [Thermothielavioides terrestris NRRL 8126]SPQ25045.1 e0e185c5-27d9-43f4-8059-f8840bc1bd96 [Thermothielavioides terrestris]